MAFSGNALCNSFKQELLEGYTTSKIVEGILLSLPCIQTPRRVTII